MKATIIAILAMLAAPMAWGQEHPFDKQMQEYGLVDIQTLDSSILVELKYSTTDFAASAIDARKLSWSPLKDISASPAPWICFLP